MSSETSKHSETGNPQGLFERIEKSRNSAPSGRTQIDCGQFDMRITRDGTWHYRGSPIHRKPLVTLFSSVLRRDADGQFWLETPVERGRIDVDDAPFVAVAMDVEGSGPDQVLIFHTNLDETVTAGPDHPIRVTFDESTGEPSPYVLVRDNLEALMTRAVFYELAELAVEHPQTGLPGVWSGRAFYPLEEEELLG
jgi:hypothetical protein